MTSVDELFKKSGVPSKRKLDPVRDPSQVYKSAKLSSNGDRSRHAQVEDEDDVEAGPAPPPEDGEDGDYGPELPPDDEDGRFFGSGMSKQQTDVMDFVDSRDETADTTAPEKIDAAWLRKTALGFEKIISKNAELRARFENDPQKFIASEADLDTSIKELSILSDHPDLWGEFARLGCVGSLVGLLAHENTDIAIDAVEIIGELTDDDVAADDEQWNPLVDAMLDADLLGLLVSNLNRLNEDDEADRSGVYHALSVIENILSRKSIAEKVGQDEVLLKWLLGRVQRKESPPVSQNKQYAAELLAIIAQTSSKTRQKLAALDTVDVALQLVASYRKRDPEKGGEEEEYMQDLFEALTSLSDEPEGKARFVEAEGVELCLIMLKEGKMSKMPALRLLDHAVGGQAGAEVCMKLIEAGGLKTTFTMFMKRQDGQTVEHFLGIFASLLRLLPAESAERIRTLAKFVEKEYEKAGKLVALRRDYASRVGVVEAQIEEEKKDMDEEERSAMADEWFSRRLEAGLFSLQTIDVVLAWLIAEDGGARRRIQKLLAERDEDFGVIRATLTEQLEGLDEEWQESKDASDMLKALLECLR